MAEDYQAWIGRSARAEDAIDRLRLAGLGARGASPLTLTLSRKRERGRSGDTGFPLPRQWERVRVSRKRERGRSGDTGFPLPRQWERDRVRVGSLATVSPASGRGDAAATPGSLSHASGRGTG
jgi:hypothetical protein